MKEFSESPSLVPNELAAARQKRAQRETPRLSGPGPRKLELIHPSPDLRVNTADLDPLLFEPLPYIDPTAKLDLTKEYLGVDPPLALATLQGRTLPLPADGRLPDTKPLWHKRLGVPRGQSCKVVELGALIKELDAEQRRGEWLTGDESIEGILPSSLLLVDRLVLRFELPTPAPNRAIVEGPVRIAVNSLMGKMELGPMTLVKQKARQTVLMAGQRLYALLTSDTQQSTEQLVAMLGYLRGRHEAGREYVAYKLAPKPDSGDSAESNQLS